MWWSPLPPLAIIILQCCYVYLLETLTTKKDGYPSINDSRAGCISFRTVIVLTISSVVISWAPKEPNRLWYKEKRKKKPQCHHQLSKFTVRLVTRRNVLQWISPSRNLWKWPGELRGQRRFNLILDCKSSNCFSMRLCCCKIIPQE